MVGRGKWRAAAAAQCALAAVVLVTLTFAPPVHGRTLLVPVDGRPVPEGMLDEMLLFRLAPGPLPGPDVDEGRGRALAGPLFEGGILMLAAPAALCGADAPGSDGE